MRHLVRLVEFILPIRPVRRRMRSLVVVCSNQDDQIDPLTLRVGLPFLEESCVSVFKSLDRLELQFFGASSQATHAKHRIWAFESSSFYLKDNEAHSNSYYQYTPYRIFPVLEHNTFDYRRENSKIHPASRFCTSWKAPPAERASEYLIWGSLF